MLSGVIASAVSLAATSVHASELVWTAPAACPVQQTVEEMLSERVGLDYRSVGDFHFQVEVSRIGDERWRLKLRFEQPATQTGREERTIEGVTCSSVADAGVVVMALALEHEARDVEPVAASTAGTPGESAPQARGLEQPEAGYMGEPAEPIGTQRNLEVAMNALALVDSGALPEVAFGAELGGQLRVSRLVLRAAAFGFPRVKHEIAHGRGGEFQLFGSALAGCYLVRELPLAATSCAGFEAGALLGEGYGTAIPKSEASLWLGPTLDVGASARLARGVALTLRLGLVVALNRESFVLEEDEVVHEPDEVSWRGGIGISFFAE